MKVVVIIFAALISSQANAAMWTPLQDITSNLCEIDICQGTDDSTTWVFHCSNPPVTTAPPNSFLAIFMAPGCYCPCPSYNYDWYEKQSE